MERNVNNIDNVIRKLILIDGTLYVKCMEKLSEGKIRVDLQKDYAAYINEGGTIHFGKDFFKRPVKEQLFILMHEMMHEILLHFMRFKNNIKIKKGGKIVNLTHIINIATDLAINSSLKMMIEENSKLKSFIDVPRDALLPSKFNFPEGRSAEFYLIQFLKNLDKILNNNSLPQNFDNHEGDNFNENESESGNGNRNKNEDESENNENVEVIEINENVDEVMNRISEKIKSNNNISNNKDLGEGEGLIKRIVERITGTNTINWKSIIKNNLINFIKTLSTKVEEKIDRKNLVRNVKVNGLPIIMPMIYKKKETNKINIHIFIDTSGSISQKELSEFLYQITKITEDVNYINDLNVYLFSENIYYKTKIEINKEKIKEKIEEIAKKIQTGGTSFKEIEEIYNKDKDKGIYIVFTDGYAEMIDIKSNRNKRLIWIIVNNREFQDKNKNTVIHIEV